MGEEFSPAVGGRLLLWHGIPGTGKTYALRALGWEWRSWCDFHYVTDPETLLRLEPDLHARRAPERATRTTRRDRWRLLILEDTGELLAADAKERTGQGLSRLLNVVDGLIGQGLRVLVLVTTNETLRSLHPAVSRPGRCASQIEFAAFTAEEAAEWLAAATVPTRAARRHARARCTRVQPESSRSSRDDRLRPVTSAGVRPPASVVSTASTRPLYGRGAGSTPAGGSIHTLVAQRKSAGLRRQRTLVRFQPGVPDADVAQTEERRSATSERPVRSVSPEHSVLRSSVVGQFGRRTMTAADLHHRSTGRIETVIGRAPGVSREVAGSRPAPSTSTGGVAQSNTPFRTPRPWLTGSRRIAPCGS